ncbi:hypothetical protein XFF6992_270040 [Xanthomonas citri pv. fuscans]|nr:hypothetical protein XFF6992_270040 [Xanthomonas citri pv. fuscans]
MHAPHGGPTSSKISAVYDGYNYESKNDLVHGTAFRRACCVRKGRQASGKQQHSIIPG